MSRGSSPEASPRPNRFLAERESHSSVHTGSGTMRDDRLTELLRAYDEPVPPRPAFDARLLGMLRTEAGFGDQSVGGGRRWGLRLPAAFEPRFRLAGGRVALVLVGLAMLLIAALGAEIVGAFRP